MDRVVAIHFPGCFYDLESSTKVKVSLTVQANIHFATQLSSWVVYACNCMSLLIVSLTSGHNPFFAIVLLNLSWFPSDFGQLQLTLLVYLETRTQSPHVMYMEAFGHVCSLSCLTFRTILKSNWICFPASIFQTYAYELPFWFLFYYLK